MSEAQLRPPSAGDDTASMRAGYHLFEKDREIVVSDGTQIVYTVRGSGASGLDVVLANGWACSDVFWSHLVPALEDEGHRVVVLDTRGHGSSGFPRPPGPRARNLRPEDFALERIADDLLEVCDREGIEAAVFAGHSMGVQTVLEVYRAAPRRVRGLVCLAGPYENPLRTFYGSPVADLVFPAVRTLAGLTPAPLLRLWHLTGRLPPAIGHGLVQLLRAGGPKLTATAFAPYLAHLSTRDPLVFLKIAEAMRSHSAADVLPRVHVPVLVLAAGRDTFSPLDCQRRMHAELPDSELVVFDDATHCLPLEEPEAVNEVVRGFLLERVLGAPPAGRDGGGGGGSSAR